MAIDTDRGPVTSIQTGSIGPAAAERHGQEGLSPTLQRSFDAPDSATCQLQIVEADESTTFDAILTTDLSKSRVVMFLTWLRAVPARMGARLRGREAHPLSADATIGGLIEAGTWIVLERRPPRELALGLSIWDADVEARGLTPARFHAPAAGAVRVGWSFGVARLSPTRSLLITETRAEGVDERGRRRFRRYWRLISPFASLTRRLVLRAIAEEAERRGSFGRVSHGEGSIGGPSRVDADRPSGPPAPPRLGPLRHGLQRAELQRIAADQSDPRHEIAAQRLEIRRRRDELCERQRDWEDFDIPGELGPGTSRVPGR